MNLSGESVSDWDFSLLHETWYYINNNEGNYLLCDMDGAFFFKATLCTIPDFILTTVLILAYWISELC